jgi:outer membrane protein OmpA-like peptidoglycan-associated protein
MDGGIAGGETGNVINKTGVGTLEFINRAVLEYYGDFNITGGKVSVINNSDAFIGSLNVAAGGTYSTKDDNAGKITNVGDAAFYGTLETDVDQTLETADIVFARSSLRTGASGSVIIGAGSKLKLNMFADLLVDESTITVIKAENLRTGQFYQAEFIGAGYTRAVGGLNYFIDYSVADEVNVVLRKSMQFEDDDYTHNQNSVKDALDMISAGFDPAATGGSADLQAVINEIRALSPAQRKQAFDQLSGSIIANALKIGSVSYGKEQIFERLKKRICPQSGEIANSIWGQGFVFGSVYDETDDSVDDFKVRGYGFEAGADLFTGKNAVGGIYAGYTKTGVKQWNDKGSFDEIGAGVYGGWFGEKFDVKARLFGGKQNYEIKRNMPLLSGRKTTAEFEAYGVKADLDAEYNIGINDKLTVSPFAEVKSGYVMNENIKDTTVSGAELEVYEDGYLRLEGTLGLGARYNVKRLSLYGKVYGGYLFMGQRAEYKGEFIDAGRSMNIWGAEQGRLGAGIGAGAEYEITKNWSAYANILGNTADGVRGYYANIGINYKFCKSGAADKKAEEEHSRLEQEILLAREQEELRLQKEREEEEKARLEAEKRAAQEEEMRKREEQLMKELQDAELAKDKAEAEARRMKELVKQFSLTLNFASNKHNVLEKDKDEIKRIAEEIKKLEYSKITIEGHTDNTGSRQFNAVLSRNRAKSVMNEFVINGIPQEKIKSAGFADTMPVAENKTKEGRAKNRRTEVFVE